MWLIPDYMTITGHQGFFRISKISDLKELALARLSTWARRNGVGVNPARRYKVRRSASLKWRVRLLNFWQRWRTWSHSGHETFPSWRATPRWGWKKLYVLSIPTRELLGGNWVFGHTSSTVCTGSCQTDIYPGRNYQWYKKIKHWHTTG